MSDVDDFAGLDDLVAALGRAVTARRPSRGPKVPFDFNAGPVAGRFVYVPPGTSREEADAIFAAAHPVITKPLRRKRVAALLVPPPPAAPHVVLHGGRPVMSVALTGDLARGRRFILDLLAWERVARFLGTEWVVREPDGAEGPAYVTSGRTKALATARLEVGSVVLARWLARAEPGAVVAYANGDTLDLTGRNLIVVDRKEHWDAHRVRTGRADGVST